jgi:hypothetical protein
VDGSRTALGPTWMRSSFCPAGPMMVGPR